VLVTITSNKRRKAARRELQMSSPVPRGRVLLTDGENRSVLAACRGLRAAGFEVDVVAGAHPAPTHWSRTCGEAWALPAAVRDEAGFLDGLTQIARAKRYDLLLAGSDASLLAISAQRSRLEPHVQLALPPHQTVLAATSKWALRETAADCGFGELRTIVCSGVESVLAAARTLGFPVVLKPIRSVVVRESGTEHRGSATVTDEQELRSLAAGFGDPCMLQAYGSGPVTSFAGVFADRRLLASAVSRYARTWPPAGGNVCYSQTIEAPPALDEAVCELLGGLGWDGPFELELIGQPHGSFVPIDLNPRVYGSLALALRAGANLPAIWCEWVLEHTARAPVRARAGVFYRWDADLRHLAVQAREHDPAAAAAVLRPRAGTAHAHFAADDPGPLAARAILVARKAAARARRRNRRAPSQVAVIGAGPYGLSTAVHLRRAGVPVRVLGEPFEFWRNNMPEGMILRSRKRSTHISDPDRRLTIDRYEAAENVTVSRPSLTLDEFLAYGAWYQRNGVAEVDRRKVRRVEREDGGFALDLDDGSVMRADRVVVAAGLEPFGHRPAPWDTLPRSLVHHASEINDLSGFAGKRVLVIGGGQSALESSALLHEAGADVELAIRGRGVEWLRSEDPATRVPLRVRAAPPTDVGSLFTGWPAAAPDLYRRLPARAREEVSSRCLRPRASSWLRPRLQDVPVQAGRRVVEAEAQGAAVHVRLDDGSERTVDRVVLGTGYRVDVTRYPFLSPRLALGIETANGYPRLAPGLESTVPGLHFVGAPASLSFGPIVRFVVGTWFAAPAVAQHIRGCRQPPIRFSF
jgi:FAD-dependent urate hydroxylase